jgi:hypothetical protein
MIRAEVSFRPVRGVACDADLEAAAALPPGPSKPGGRMIGPEVSFRPVGGVACDADLEAAAAFAAGAV